MNNNSDRTTKSSLIESGFHETARKEISKVPGTFYVLSKCGLLRPLLLELTHLTRGHLTFPELSRGDDATRLSEWQSVVDILSRPEGDIFGEVIFWAGIPSLPAIEGYILWP